MILDCNPCFVLAQCSGRSMLLMSHRDQYKAELRAYRDFYDALRTRELCWYRKGELLPINLYSVSERFRSTPSALGFRGPGACAGEL